MTPDSETKCQLDRACEEAERRATEFEADFAFVDTFLKPFPYVIALVTAKKVGVLGALSVEGCRPEALALASGLSEDRVRSILRLLSEMSVVEGIGSDNLRLTQRGKRISAEWFGHPVIGAHLRMYEMILPSLPDYAMILAAEMPGSAMHWPPQDHGASVDFEGFMTPTIRFVAAWLDKVFDFSDTPNLLDVGGGDGSMAALLCGKHPSLKATVLNLEWAREAVHRTVEQHSVGSRVSFYGADFLSQPLPSGYDVILFSRMLCDWGDDVVRRLLNGASSSLLTGGAVIIVEALASPKKQWNSDPWFLFWETLVPGYAQNGFRTEACWRSLSSVTGFVIEDIHICRNPPLQGIGAIVLRRSP